MEADRIWRSGSEEGALLLMVTDELTEDQQFEYVAANPPTPFAIAWLINEAKRRGVSERARTVAASKNRNAQEFAKAQWQTAKASNSKLSKRTFADELVPRLAKRPFLLTVRPETIAYDWLKGL